jgi:hypothetical protein
MLSHDFDAWIAGFVPVSSDDDPFSVPLDLPFLRFGEPLVGNHFLQFFHFSANAFAQV